MPTFIAAGLKYSLPLKLAVIITDPGGLESLLDGMELHAPKGMDVLPMDRLFYRYIPQTSQDWQALIKMATMVNRLTYKHLADLKIGLEKDKHLQYLDMLNCMANFTDQHGKEHGPIDNFDNTWMVAIDSLSGVNDMVQQLHVGLKPSLHQGEWQVTMNTEAVFMKQLVASTQCFTCLTGHVEKEMDEILGKPQYMVGLLGKRLAPKLPRVFSDIILQCKDDNKFMWSTVRKDYSGLKARNLPLRDDLPPDFGQIVEKWLSRQKLVGKQLTLNV